MHAIRRRDSHNGNSPSKTKSGNTSHQRPPHMDTEYRRRPDPKHQGTSVNQRPPSQMGDEPGRRPEAELQGNPIYQQPGFESHMEVEYGRHPDPRPRGNPEIQNPQSHHQQAQYVPQASVQGQHYHNQQAWQGSAPVVDKHGPQRKQMKQSMREPERTEVPKPVSRPTQAGVVIVNPFDMPTLGQFTSKMRSWFNSGGFEPRPEMNDYYEEPRQRTPVNDRELFDQINWLQQEIATKNSLVDKLQKELNDEKRLSEKIKLSADKMQMTLDNKEAFVGAQQSDDMILTGFRQLFGQVKTWVSMSLTASPGADAKIDVKYFEAYQAVVPGQQIESVITEIMNSSKKRRFFFRGCVAETLCTEVFRSSERDYRSAKYDLWLGPDLSGSLAKLEHRLVAPDSGVPTKMVHDWRALTVELLSKPDQGLTAAEDRKRYLLRVCQPLLDAMLPWTSPDARNEAAERLHRILHDAVDLSQILRRQRASWSVRNLDAIARAIPKDTGGNAKCKFVGGAMRDVDDEGYGSDDQSGYRERYVNIMIEPSLFKRGNADGENFEVETCMSPALVRCST